MKYLVAYLAAGAALMAGVIVGTRFPHSDGLQPIPQFAYTNTYPGLTIVCTWRGTRADFAEDGSDIAAGDRVVRDCVARG